MHFSQECREWIAQRKVGTDLGASPLLKEGYCRCTYVELNCKQCGCWRMCVDPETEVPCPNCDSRACSVTVMANGLTVRKLPIVEQYLSAASHYHRGIQYNVQSTVPYAAEMKRRGKRFRQRISRIRQQGN